MAFSNTLVLCFFFAITMALPTQGTVHVVGDALGWTLDSDYTTWASDKTFVVGDSLVFNYEAGWHTVDEVRESDYKTCTTRDSISTDSSGATTIPLEKVGTHYFICAVPVHCISGGMKLSVKVKASSASAAPSATPSSGKGSPSNGTPDTITIAPSTTTIATPTVQNASSTSLSPIVGLFFVVMLISYILM